MTMIGFRCYRMGRSLVALQHTPSLPSLSQRKRSDEYKKGIESNDTRNNSARHDALLTVVDFINQHRQDIKDIGGDKESKAMIFGSDVVALQLKIISTTKRDQSDESIMHNIVKENVGLVQGYTKEPNKKEAVLDALYEKYMDGVTRSNSTPLDALTTVLSVARQAMANIGAKESEALPFESERETKRELSRILRGHRIDLEENSDISTRTYLSHEDKAVVMAALENYPDASKIIGCGVDAIFVAKVNVDFGFYCFHVKRIDGSEEDLLTFTCLFDEKM